MRSSRRRAWVIAATLVLIGAWGVPARAQQGPTPPIPPPSPPHGRGWCAGRAGRPDSGHAHARGPEHEDEPGLRPPRIPGRRPCSPAILRRPIEAAPATDLPRPLFDTGPFLLLPMDPPIGYTGPSGVLPTESQESSHFVPVEDRWRIGFPEWDRYDKGHPVGDDYPYMPGRMPGPVQPESLQGRLSDLRPAHVPRHHRGRQHRLRRPRRSRPRPRASRAPSARSRAIPSGSPTASSRSTSSRSRSTCSTATPRSSRSTGGSS